VEQFLKEEIRHRYPDHGFFGEESGHANSEKAEYLWAIDPIDGTAPFCFEMPVWGISIGFLVKSRPLVGLFYMPVPDELYWAADGGAAYMNHQRIHVCEPCPMGKGTTIVAPSITFRRMKVNYRGRALVFGSASAHICYVARGKIHGGLIDTVRLYDIAGPAAILQAAGGVLRYHSGRKLDLWELRKGQKTPEPLFMGHPDNVEQLLELFAKEPD